MRVVGCLLFVSFQPIHASHTEVESSLPNGHSLFPSSLSDLSPTHCYRSIYIHICFVATENSSVFNLCCTELLQHNHVHSIRWPFTHPFACKHIHIQLTIRSYHRHMLSYLYMSNVYLNRQVVTFKAQSTMVVISGQDAFSQNTMQAKNVSMLQLQTSKLSVKNSGKVTIVLSCRIDHHQCKRLRWEGKTSVLTNSDPNT